MSNRPDALTRLRELNGGARQHQPESTGERTSSHRVRPFTGAKSSWWRNPLRWLAQVVAEGEVQTDVHANSLRNQAERAKAYDNARTRSDVRGSRVLEIMVDEQTERRAQLQFRRSAVGDGIGTGDAITTLAGYISLQRPELEKMLEGLPQPVKEKVLREYDLVIAGVTTRLRLNVHGLQDEPIHFDRRELL